MHGGETVAVVIGEGSLVLTAAAIDRGRSPVRLYVAPAATLVQQQRGSVGRTPVMRTFHQRPRRSEGEDGETAKERPPIAKGRGLAKRQLIGRGLITTR